MAKNWRVPQDMGDLLVATGKRLNSLERRPGAASTVVTMLGPTQNQSATLVGDWNTSIAAVNGYVWSRPGALHAPDLVRSWTGTVVARSDGSGMQQAWNTDDLDDVQYRMRTYVLDDTGQGRTFSEWRDFATPTGFIEMPHLGDTVQDVLDDIAAGMGFLENPLKVYRQATAPTNPDTDGRDLWVGDQWIDTDDSNHPYLWDGTTWTDYGDYVLGDIPAAIDAAQAAAEAAAADAAEAILDAADAYSHAESEAAAAYAAAIAAAAVDATTKAGAAQSAAITAAATDATTKAAAAQSAATSAAATAAATAYGPTTTLVNSWKSGADPTKIDGGDIAANTVVTNALAATAIDGMTITGALIRTHSGATTGVKLSTTGFTAYNGGGVATLTIDASTGAISMLGALTSGSTVTGATVTGGTLQSEATASRGIKITSGGMTGYDASGNPTLTYNASTGAVTIKGTLLVGSSVPGSALPVIGGGNRLPGSSYEDSITGYHLTPYQSSGSVSTDVTAVWGSKVGKFTATTGTSIEVYFGSGANVPVIPGRPYTFSVYVRGTAAFAAPDVYLYWRDAGGSGMGASSGAGSAVTTTGWTRITFTATAPAGVSNALGSLYFPNGGGVPVGQSLYVDAAQIEEGEVATAYAPKPDEVLPGTISTTMLVATAIDGMTVTGATLQTSSSASTGLKITSGGLVGYGSGIAKVTLDTSGNLILDGAVTGAGTITGPVLQTTATAARGVKIASGGLTAYNASGVASVIIDAATGNLTITGTAATALIDSATVRGGQIETSSSANTGIKLNSSGLTGYGSGAAKFTLDATTGSVTLAGTMTGAGTITGPIFQTNTSGNRIVIRDAGVSGGIIEFWTDAAGDSAGRLASSLYGGTRQRLTAASGSNTASPNPATLNLTAGATAAGAEAEVNAGMFSVQTLGSVLLFRTDAAGNTTLQAPTGFETRLAGDTVRIASTALTIDSDSIFNAYVSGGVTTAVLATTANDTLSGLAARDGVTPVAGDLVLVPAQTTTANNGLYIAAAGAWSRWTGADSALKVARLGIVQVRSGTVNGGSRWVTAFKSTNTVGTTAMTWAPVGVGGKAVRRWVATNMTYTNPTTYTVINDATERTNMTGSVIKTSGATRLILHVSASVQNNSGVAQLYYIGLRDTATGTVYDVARGYTPAAVTRIFLNGDAEITGLAPGTYTFEPVVKSGTSTSMVFFTDDFISWSVIETG